MKIGGSVKNKKTQAEDNFRAFSVNSAKKMYVVFSLFVVGVARVDVRNFPSRKGGCQCAARHRVYRTFFVRVQEEWERKVVGVIILSMLLAL